MIGNCATFLDKVPDDVIEHKKEYLYRAAREHRESGKMSMMFDEDVIGGDVMVCGVGTFGNFEQDNIDKAAFEVKEKPGRISVITWPREYAHLGEVGDFQFYAPEYVAYFLNYASRYSENIHTDRVMVVFYERDENGKGCSLSEYFSLLETDENLLDCEIDFLFDASMTCVDLADFTSAEFCPEYNDDRGRRDKDIACHYRGNPDKLFPNCLELIADYVKMQAYQHALDLFDNAYRLEIVEKDKLAFASNPLTCQGEFSPVGYEYVDGLIELMSDGILDFPSIDEGTLDMLDGRNTETNPYSVQMCAPLHDKDLKIVDALYKFTSEGHDIIAIWEQAQMQSKMPRVLPCYLDLIYRQQDSVPLDAQVYEEQKHLLGIDLMLSSYYDGVPIEDILA